jgi:hypothetical protein
MERGVGLGEEGGEGGRQRGQQTHLAGKGMTPSPRADANLPVPEYVFTPSVSPFSSHKDMSCKGTGKRKPAHIIVKRNDAPTVGGGGHACNAAHTRLSHR